jgi:hypothetical protein
MKKPRASAAFSLLTECLRALRTDAKEFEFVDRGLETVCRGDTWSGFGGEINVALHGLRAPDAGWMDNHPLPMSLVAADVRRL